jgi:dienelactone hydrolase
MSIILVSDVFGVTPALLAISEKLGSCSIVDPYKGQIMGFQNETEAYSYFTKEIGLDNYLSSLLQTLDSIDYQATLIGFSVGASVIWRLSEKKGNNLIKQGFCYYGSQIRNFTEIEPRFNLCLVFPKSEPHFDVVELQDNLRKKANVKTKKVEYLHGFMNYHSNNYNSFGYNEHINLLRSITS